MGDNLQSAFIKVTEYYGKEFVAGKSNGQLLAIYLRLKREGKIK